MISIKKIHSSNFNNDLVQKIFRIENACFEPSIAWGLFDLSYQLNTVNSQLIVATDEADAIQGYCIFSKNSNLHRIHIKAIAVHPSAQNHGYALMMLQKAIHVTSENTSYPWSVTLECRPANEDYYKNIGFKVTAPPQPNYYNIDQISLPAISMQAHTLSRPEATKIPVKNQNRPLEITLLLNLVLEVKENTSWWYRAFKHSARKEKAFEAIYLELQAHLATNKPLTQVQYERILRAIVSNALMVRCQWSSGISHTKSANKALTCLQSPKYESLKQLIAPGKQNIDYAHLVTFAGFNKNADRHSIAAKEYPYFHFFKRQTPVAVHSQPLVNNNKVYI